jgi:hypothetical protein
MSLDDFVRKGSGPLEFFQRFLFFFAKPANSRYNALYPQMLSLKSGGRFQWLRAARLQGWFLLLLLTLFWPPAAWTQDDDEGRAQIDEALRHMGEWVWDKTTFDWA